MKIFIIFFFLMDKQFILSLVRLFFIVKSTTFYAGRYVQVKNQLYMRRFVQQKFISPHTCPQISPPLAQITLTHSTSMFEHLGNHKSGQIQRYVSFFALLENSTKQMAQKYRSTRENKIHIDFFAQASYGSSYICGDSPTWSVTVTLTVTVTITGI